jgi:hypothetical protein
MIAPSREGSNVQILCLFRLHLFEICILLNQQRGSFLLCSAEWTCDGSLVTIVKKGSLVIDILELLVEEKGCGSSSSCTSFMNLVSCSSASCEWFWAVAPKGDVSIPFSACGISRVGWAVGVSTLRCGKEHHRVSEETLAPWERMYTHTFPPSSRQLKFCVNA